MRVSKRSSFNTAPAVLETRYAHAKTRIDLPGPSRTLERTVSDIELDEKIAGAEAADHSKGKSDINDDRIDKEHGYDMDTRQLV